MEVDKKSPVEPQMAQNRKVTKNVSFESDAVADRDGGSDQEMVVTNLKRGKHYYTAVNSSNSEIVAKKDKRHRGGIKNSLFGAEGKYSDMKNDIPDDEHAHRSQGVTKMETNSIETTKKLDEITPLLCQATISNTSGVQQSPQIANPTSTDTTNGVKSLQSITEREPHSRKSHSQHHSSTGSGKSSHRKKFKTKSGRKAASYNLAENNFSDSDKN